MTANGVGISAERMAEVFPFHVAVGADLHIVQAGPVIQRLVPEIIAGGRLTDHFVIRRPSGVSSFAEICARTDGLFILEARRRALLLRGQMVRLSESIAAFLGSPWVTSMSELENLGLSLHEFAIHDPIADLLVLLQAKDRVLADAQHLAEELRASRRPRSEG